MDNANKSLIMAAGIVLTILVITIGFTLYNKSKSTSDSAMNQLDNLNTTLAESDFTQYDGASITGMDVINIIAKYKNDVICITVDNGRSETEYIYNSSLTAAATGAISDAKDKTNLNKYINPNATFIGEVIRDEQTLTITGLTFKIKN